MNSDEIKIMASVIERLCNNPPAYDVILAGAAEEHKTSRDISLGAAILRNRLNQIPGSKGVRSIAAAGNALCEYDGPIAITGRITLWVLRRHLYRKSKRANLTDLEINMMHRVAQAISKLNEG